MVNTVVSLVPSPPLSSPNQAGATITAHPVNRAGSSSGQPHQAKVTGQGCPPKMGKPELLACYKGAYASIPISEKGLEESTVALWKKTQEIMNRVWDKAVKQLPSHAITLTVNYSQFYISYQVVGDDGKLEIRRLPIDSFRDDMKEVREAGKKLWMKVYHGASDPDGEFNRSITGDRPFEKSTNLWERLHPKTFEDFLTEAHFGVLWNKLSDDEKGTAARKLRAADCFINEMNQKIHDLLVKAEEENKPQNLSPLPSHERARKQEALSHLRELDERMKGLDRYPIYWAVALSGDRSISSLDKKERYQIADRITNGVNQALSGNVSDNHRGSIRKIIDKVTFAGESEKLEKVGPFIRAYAMDAGDLVIHDRLEHIDRTEMTNDGAEKRTLRTVSMEEFITHNIANLSDGAFDVGNALGSFGLKLDDITKGELTKEVEDIRAQALNKALQNHCQGVSSWQDAAKALAKK